MSLSVTDIQHFCIGDGDGIRTTLFLSGCNMFCPWCHNPETVFTGISLLNFSGQAAKPRALEMQAGEIASELLADEPFYQMSGGGVTISGGECMLHAKNLLPLLKILKNNKIHITVDTAANVEYRLFELINPYADMYLFDIKSADAERLKSVTGGDLNLITANYKSLISDGKRVRVRIPLIPKFNIGEEDIGKLTGLLKALDIKEIDLLPFHRLGGGKYQAMGLKYAYGDYPSMTAAEAEEIKKLYQRHFKVKIEI